MNAFDIELVGKVGSMALVNKKWGDVDYNVIAHISRQLCMSYSFRWMPRLLRLPLTRRSSAKARSTTCLASARATLPAL